MPNSVFYPDSVTLIRRDGARRDNISAQIGRGKITTEDATHTIEDGDEIQRVRPDGGIDRFLVLDNGYLVGMGGSAGTFGGPHYSMKVEKINDLPKRETATSIVYNLHGANSRVNNRSHDESINVVNASSPEVFAQLREAIAKGVRAEAGRDDLLAKVAEMEEDQDKPSFADHLKNFIMIGGAYMSFIGPFLPALAQMGR